MLSSKIVVLEILREVFRRVFPGWLKRKIRHYLDIRRKNLRDRQLVNLSTQQLFTKIYEKAMWGKSNDPAEKFFSGPGSHDPNIVDPYIQAIEGFIASLAKKPNVVDLGCGDFAIGSKFRHLCNDFVACDIVEPLIIWNKQRYKDDSIDFRVLDITKDPLPSGDIVFIRQVLQHLSNDQIIRIIPEIIAKYKFLVLTEHLPKSDTYVPNIDQVAGPDYRLDQHTGIVLTSPPFNLRICEETHLCDAFQFNGKIRTILYRLI